MSQLNDNDLSTFAVVERCTSRTLGCVPSEVASKRYPKWKRLKDSHLTEFGIVWDVTNQSTDQAWHIWLAEALNLVR